MVQERDDGHSDKRLWDTVGDMMRISCENRSSVSTTVLVQIQLESVEFTESREAIEDCKVDSFISAGWVSSVHKVEKGDTNLLCVVSGVITTPGL